MDTSKHLNRPLRVGGGITCAALLIAVALTSACGEIACEKTLTCAPDDSSSGGDGMGGEADSSEGSGAGTNGSSGGSGGDGDGDGGGDGDGDVDGDVDGDGDGDSPLSCDDGLDCTDDLQTTDGQCVHVTQESFCVIDGGCIGDGEENPEDSCQACVSEVSPSRWSAAKSEGESCDFCRECSADAQCVKAEECCDVAEHPHNAFVCGLHVSEETLVEDGCGAGESSVFRSEIHSSTSSTDYTCSAGTWNFWVTPIRWFMAPILH